MIIVRGQYWRETNDHLWIKIYEAWYGAWSKFGWLEGTQGIGIAVEILAEADKLGKKIGVKLLKYPAKYEITVKRALEAGESNAFKAKDGKPLYIIPITAFDRV